MNRENPRDYHSEWAVESRWLRKMNKRLQIDCLLMNKFLYERKDQEGVQHLGEMLHEYRRLPPRMVQKPWGLSGYGVKTPSGAKQIGTLCPSA